MLGKLELKLKSKDKLEYQMSSLFHGALMEVLPEKYADYLHTSQLHPYTQHLEFREGEWYWIICCLNKEAIKIIIQDTLWNIENIDDFHELLQNPVCIIGGWKPSLDKQESLHTLKSYIEDDDRWAIVLKEHKKAIGFIRLFPDNNRGQYDAKMINYLLNMQVRRIC